MKEGTDTETTRLERSDGDYPPLLTEHLGIESPRHLYIMGKTSILNEARLGLVCSIRCPGSLIVKTLDAARALRDAGICVVGGFHSPMEQEFLDILLRGEQPVVFCAAKRLRGLRMGSEARRGLAGGTLLAISPFDGTVRRTTAAQAVKRNDIVAALSKLLFVPYAAPGGKTWVTVKAALSRGQVVCTFEDEENAALVYQGVRAVDVEGLVEMVML